jgi:hypothetical protein
MSTSPAAPVLGVPLLLPAQLPATAETIAALVTPVPWVSTLGVGVGTSTITVASNTSNVTEPANQSVLTV